MTGVSHTLATRNKNDTADLHSVHHHHNSLNRLAKRLKAGKETTISFDKDDDDTLDFVTATANLRAASYAIERKTRWEVKGMNT